MNECYVALRSDLKCQVGYMYYTPLMHFLIVDLIDSIETRLVTGDVYKTVDLLCDFIVIPVVSL